MSFQRNWPPSSVNFAAFVSRFSMICGRPTGSPLTIKGSSLIATAKWCCAHRSAPLLIPRLDARPSHFYRFLPEHEDTRVSRAISSKSSTRRVMWSTCRVMVLAHERRLSAESTNRNASAALRMGESGCEAHAPGWLETHPCADRRHAAPARHPYGTEYQRWNRQIPPVFPARNAVLQRIHPIVGSVRLAQS